MSGVGTDPEDTANELDRHGEFDAAELMREMATEIQRLTTANFEAAERAQQVIDDLREQLAAPRTAACPCYPNPFDHEDHCPQRYPTES